MIVSPSHCFTRKYRNALHTLNILESLEPRALMAATIQVSGNGQIIANNDNKPSTADYTDFRYMSTTPDATIGTVHRTYTITNTGNAALSLTGAGPVTVSGAGAADFSVAAQPATSVNPAGTTTFTINFVPTKVGARTAKLTIHTNDPAHKTFSFTITGKGIVTTNDPTNHLQTATIGQINTHLASNSLVGLTSAFFDNLGYQTDGFLAFDSISNIQNPGPELAVDTASGNITGEILHNGTVSTLTIEGWRLGLQGIKIGETRALIVPAALAFGNDTSSGILAGQTLIFEVTCKPPTLVVQGLPQVSAVRIASGDTTPSADDGTLLGTIPRGSTVGTLTSSFALSNGGAGTLNLAPSNGLTITGKGPKDFSVGFLGTDSSFVGIQVAFHPSKPGTQSAIVTLRTNDPVHPVFTFTVSGTLVGWNDLGVGAGTVNFPASGTVTAGASTKYKFPLIVTNVGNQVVDPKSAPLDVKVYLHNTTSDILTLISPDPLTSTIFRNLGVGKSKTLTLSLPIPAGIVPGTYDLRVKVDSLDTLTELSQLNNTGTSSQLITIQ